LMTYLLSYDVIEALNATQNGFPFQYFVKSVNIRKLAQILQS
jgi:hypothetical protein